MQKCLLISGRVQGVGFRYYAVRHADKIGDISGYVTNLPNGDVLVLAESNEDKLNQFISALNRGPLFSRVDKIIETPEHTLLFPNIENGVFKRL